MPLVFYNIWIWTFIRIIGIVVSNERRDTDETENRENQRGDPGIHG